MRRGQGMSIAEIRPYQPGDTMKQIDWMSTAKKSQLMTKLTHQEEQIRLMHLIGPYDAYAHQAVLTITSAISYAALKYGDMVAGIIGSEYTGATRKRTTFTQFFETLKNNTLGLRRDQHVLRRCKKSLCSVVLTDFPDESQWDDLRTLSQTNSIILIMPLSEQMIDPVKGSGYAYDGYDLLPYQINKYRQIYTTLVTQTKQRLSARGGKCIIINTDQDILSQLATQRTF